MSAMAALASSRRDGGSSGEWWRWSRMWDDMSVVEADEGDRGVCERGEYDDW